MNPQETQQVVARDEKWVPSTDRVKISSINVRLEITVPQTEETIQVVIDIIKNSTCFKAFIISADVPKIFMQQFWYTIKKVKDSDYYEFLLSNKKCIVDAEVFRKIPDICPRVEGEVFTPIGYRKEKKSRRETMLFPRFTKVIINHFLKQHKSLSNLKYQHYHTIKDDGIVSRLKFIRIGEDYQEYRLAISDVMLNDTIIQSESYQMFLKYYTGQIPPKKIRGKGSQGKKTVDVSQEIVDVSEESEPETAKRRTASRRVVKKKVTIFADDNIILDPDVALELGKSNSITEAEEEKASRQVYATHARIVTDSVPEPAKKKTSSRSTRSVVIQDTPSAPKSKSATSKSKLKGTGGSSEGTGRIPGVPDESTVVSATSSEGTGTKPGIHNEEKVSTEEKVILEWGSEQESEYLEEDLSKEEEIDWIDYEEDDEKKDDTDDDKSIDLEMTDDKETDDEVLQGKEQVKDDEDEEMTNAEVEESGNGDEKDTDAKKADAEKIEEAKDDSKKAELPPTSSSLSISSGFGDQFLKLYFDTSLIGTVKDTTNVEINSLLNIKIQSEVTHIQSPSVLKIKKEHDEKQKMPKYTIKSTDKEALKKYDQKSALYQTMHEISLSTNILLITIGCTMLSIGALHLRMKMPMEEKEEKNQRVRVFQETIYHKETPKGKALPKGSKTGKYASAKEPVEEPITEVHWFNQMVSATKDPLKFNDLMANPIDFSKYAHALAASNLSTTSKSFNALTDKLDWNNSEGDSYLFDLSKPLPLQGHPGHITVAADYFFNNDLEYLKSSDPERTYTTPTKVGYDKDALKGIKHLGKRRKLWHRSQLNKFSKHNVYSTQKILGVKSVSVKKLHGYGHLEEVVMKRADRQLYKFKEGDFVDLHLNDIEDMLLLDVQHKLFHRTDSDIIDFMWSSMYVPFPEVKGWLDEDLEYYHLKELHYSAHCHTQMSLWIISRGVVLLILLMEYKVLRDSLLHRSSINNSASLSNKFGGFYFSFKFGITGLLHHVIITIAERIRDNDTSQSKQVSKFFDDILPDRLDWNNPKGDRYPFDLSKPLPLQGHPGHLTVAADYFFNNDLKYLKSSDSERTYTMSITKTKAAQYEIEGIEDMGERRKLWHISQLNKFSKHNVYSTKNILGVKSVSVKKLHGYGHLEEIVVKRVDRQFYKFEEGDFVDLHLNDIEDMPLLAVQYKLIHLTDNDIVNFIMALHMFTRSLVIKKRVEDLQLGVESYQNKLNITPPQQTFPEIEFKELYTPSHKPPGVIYEDLTKQKRVMRADELYKFSDGTLKKVRDDLHHRIRDFRLENNKEMPRRKWTAIDRKRSELMVELIDKQMRERRIIQNLERLVGARELEMDYKLMTRTV
ncbi:hypothetical protein Tco_0454898 [Tanacetum coccineum]